MNSLSLLATIFGGFGLFIGIVTFTIAYSKGNLAKETIELQEKNRAALEDRVKSLEENDRAKSKKITALESQVDTLKTLPLEKLATSYETMAQTLKSMGDTQNKLLELMTSLGLHTNNQ